MPVVSVGNITLGGTGKTPLVRWIVQWFRDRGIPVAIVSRGYGAQSGDANDEALELRRLLPDVPHIQNPDRVAAARQAVAEFGCRAIVLDDGFQHRRIGRDFDIVLLDALAPFGFGHVFPRGTLREPIEGLRRADAVVLSRADLLDPSQREDIWRTVRAMPRGPLRRGGSRPADADLRRRPTDAAGCRVGSAGRGACAASAIRPDSGIRWTSAAARSPASANFPTIIAIRLATSGGLPGGPTGSMFRPCFAPAKTWSNWALIAWATSRFGRSESRSNSSRAGPLNRASANFVE